MKQQKQPRCRKHDWEFKGQVAHPKGSAFGVQTRFQCRKCHKRSTITERSR